MPVTVAEKSHWKDRIARRIEQRIETLVAKQDPTLLQRVAEQARARAYESLSKTSSNAAITTAATTTRSNAPSRRGPKPWKSTSWPNPTWASRL